MSVNNTNNSRTSSRTRRALPNWRDVLGGVRNFYSVTSSSCQPITRSAKSLFVYGFDLLVEHSPGKSIDRGRFKKGVDGLSELLEVQDTMNLIVRALKLLK